MGKHSTPLSFYCNTKQEKITPKGPVRPLFQEPAAQDIEAKRPENPDLSASFAGLALPHGGVWGRIRCVSYGSQKCERSAGLHHEG